MFYPYTARYADTGDYVYLNTDAAANDAASEGKWTLKRGDVSETYDIAPFFANAMRLEGHEGARVTAETEDGYETDYRETVGGEHNPYEIRSVQQLQYINWNSDTKSVETLVDKGNYKKYPYLMYTKNLTSGKESNAQAAGRSGLAGRYWLQTHDAAAPEGGAFTPIAGLSLGVGSTRIPAWFGSHYDGQSYKILNVDIHTDSLTAGLFGVTVGANLKSIILYSDNGGVIERWCNKDSASSKLRYNLERCSAVVDIEINCTHVTKAHYNNNGFGNAVRVGGMAGALRF